MAQRRCKMKGIMGTAKPESAGHGAGGEKTRPRHYDDDDEKTCPTLKSGQKGRFCRYRPSDGGERAGRAEVRERPAIGGAEGRAGRAEVRERPAIGGAEGRAGRAEVRERPAIGGAEGRERGRRYARYIEVKRGESERPIQAKGKEKPARAWGGEKTGRAEGGPRFTRSNGKEKPAKVEGAEKSGGIQAAAQKRGDRKSVRNGKPNEAYNPKANERAESDTDAEEISEDDDDDYDDAPTRIENYFRICGDGCRLPVKELPLPIKFVRRPIIVEDYDSLDDDESKYDMDQMGKGIISVQRYVAPNQNTRRSKKTSFILLIAFLTASIMLLIYLTFPELNEEEKAKLKIPTTVDEAKALGQLLSKYKDNFSLCKKFNF